MRSPVGHLHVPMYVMQMGWHRWGPEAKGRWLRQLIIACRKTIAECEHLLDLIEGGNSEQ